MDDMPRREPTEKQDGEAVEIGGVAVESEFEMAEYRPHLHALQPVGTAGDRTRLVRGLRQHAGNDEGLHQERQPRRAQDDEAARKTNQSRGRRSGKEPGDWLAPMMRGEDPGGISAGAEKGGVPQGHDPRITEHQIGRQREEDRREDLRAEREIARKEEIPGEREEPRHRFERPVAVAPEKGAERGGAVLHPRPNSPRGRHNNSAIVAA
jgi:hypothetical protein